MQKITRLLLTPPPWQVWAVVGTLLVVVPAALGVSAAIGGEDSAGLGPEETLVTVRSGSLATEVPVSGRLVFPHRDVLTFDASGTVGEVLVSPGQEVSEGQLLAQLKPSDMAALEKALAQAEVNLDRAEDALEEAREDFINTPLEQARFEESIAQARVNLDQAQDGLSNFYRTYNLDLSKARQARASARAALDSAQEALEDFDRSYQQSLAQARLAETKAEAALDAARDARFDYIRSLRSGFAGPEEDPRGLRKLNEVNLAVSVAEEDLAEARKDLAELEEGPDQLKFQELEAGVDVAQASLDQANEDFNELIDGPDQEELALNEKQVERRREELAELLQGPDTLEVALQEAEVSSARTAVSDAREDLQGATIRAPFSGVISLVNLQVDDRVTGDSRVLAMVDPGLVEVDAFLDASRIGSASVGDSARVDIAALPGRTLEGTVSNIAAEPVTERGVVTYPLTIEVQVPPGVRVPVELSAVTAVVVHREEDVLLVPSSAMIISSLQPAVRVMREGQIEERTVETVGRADSWVAIRGGLEEGEEVVAAAPPPEQPPEPGSANSP